MLEWLMQHCDPDAWDKDYKDIFFGDPDKRMRERAARERIAPSRAGQEGSLNIKRVEAKPVEDISQFIGRTASQSPVKRSPLTIGPDADGNLSVSTDAVEG